MNKNVLIAFGGATLIAIVVALMLSAMLKGGHKKDVVADAGPQTQILVATADVKPGELLDNKNMKWKDWPDNLSFPGTVRKEGDQKPAEALSGRALRSIAMGEPVLHAAVAKDGGGFLAAMLAPGHRAVAIKVSAETMVGGFINPGDYVDVILTYRSHVTYESPDKALETEIKRLINRNIDQYSSETVLQHVKVIGIDQKSVNETSKNADTGGKVAKTVTLDVDERQAETLALAGKMGELSLSLRPLGDTQIDADTQAVSDNRISSIYKEITAAIERAEQDSGAYRSSVRIYNGGAVQDEPVR